MLGEENKIVLLYFFQTRQDRTFCTIEIVQYEKTKKQRSLEGGGGQKVQLHQALVVDVIIAIRN